MLRRIANAVGVPAEVIIWDAVQLPTVLGAEDRRICELAKLIVRQFMEVKSDRPSRKKKR